MQTHDDGGGKRNSNCARYVIVSRPNLYYETEKSNSVYGFLWTCQGTNYFIKSYGRPKDKSSLIPPSFDVEWNPKESWQMYDFIKYSMLVIDGFPIRNIFRFFIFWLAHPTHTRTYSHSQMHRCLFLFLYILIIIFPLTSRARRRPTIRHYKKL